MEQTLGHVCGTEAKRDQQWHETFFKNQRIEMLKSSNLEGKSFFKKDDSLVSVSSRAGSSELKSCLFLHGFWEAAVGVSGLHSEQAGVQS